VHPIASLSAPECVGLPPSSETTLFPAEQLSTDDFAGPIANNTNLGLKGILAIRAFAELCTIMQLDDEFLHFNGGRAPQHGGRAPPQHGGRAQDGVRTGRPCAEYASIAADYASTWQLYAFNATGQPPHYSMSFNVDEYQDSWSLKYNLLWQRLLRLEGPFDYDAIAALETAYYLEQANEFGTPLDPRHQYTKADWLSWVAAMSPDEGATSLRDLSEIRSCSLEISSDDAYCSWRVLGICSSLACSLQPDLRGAQHDVEPCAVHRLVRHDLRRAGHQRRLHCTPRGRRSLCQATALKRIGSALPRNLTDETLSSPIFIFVPKITCFQSWQPKGCRTLKGRAAAEMRLPEFLLPDEMMSGAFIGDEMTVGDFVFNWLPLLLVNILPFLCIPFYALGVCLGCGPDPNEGKLKFGMRHALKGLMIAVRADVRMGRESKHTTMLKKAGFKKGGPSWMHPTSSALEYGTAGANARGGKAKDQTKAKAEEKAIKSGTARFY
jgi:hypothetical protein